MAVLPLLDIRCVRHQLRLHETTSESCSRGGVKNSSVKSDIPASCGLLRLRQSWPTKRCLLTLSLKNCMIANLIVFNYQIMPKGRTIRACSSTSYKLRVLYYKTSCQRVSLANHEIDVSSLEPVQLLLRHKVCSTSCSTGGACSPPAARLT